MCIKKNHKHIIVCLALFIVTFVGCSKNNPEITFLIRTGTESLFKGHYEESYRDLVKADIFLESGENCSDEQRALLYASLCAIYVNEKDIYTALSYAEKAYGVKSYGKKYGFLYGRMLYSAGKSNEALELFKTSWKKYPDLIDKDSLRIFMYVAAEKNELALCKSLIIKNLEKGFYFDNAGTFASLIFEKLGEYENSIYAAFTDYLVTKYTGKGEDKKFITNLNRLEKEFNIRGLDHKTGKAISQIRAYLNKESPDNFSELTQKFTKYPFLINLLNEAAKK